MMTTKERIAYNQMLFEQIKTILPLSESSVYKHNMVFKDSYGNLVKIELTHFKSEESYKAFQERKEYEKSLEEEKKRKRG